MQILGTIDKKVDVAVFMLAYNHEKWIQKSIDSILKQKINFRMKIYIHDDCSTDDTKKIIEDAYQKNPKIIIPIFEETNQFSKGNSIFNIVMPLLNCDFIALCEGDDFWIEENKLQIQYDYMRSHKNCSYCFGNAMLIDTNNNPLRKFYSRYSWKDKTIPKKIKSIQGAVFSTEELILLDFTPTATVMYRGDVWNILKEYKDHFDLSLRLASTEIGESYYINKVLSAYRVGNSASAHGTAAVSVESYKENYYERHKKVYLEFDKRTNHKYIKIINRELQRKLLQVYKQFTMLDAMREQIAYNDLRTSVKLKCYLKKNFAPIFVIVRNCRNAVSRIVFR